MPTDRKRCAWARTESMVVYHDEQWGVPVHDDVLLFEMLTLEGAQAGLSWEIVLKKRDGYRKAFAGFDPEEVARFTPGRVEKLLQDPNIIRNRLKIESTISNAKAVIAAQREFGSFDAYIWQFTRGKTIVNKRKSYADLPSTTPESDAMSKALKKRGFRFVGSTICYALMQSTGMVNDHELTCWRSSII